MSTKNLKRRILNGIARHEREDIYLTEERNQYGTRIANIFYTTGCQGLRVALEKFIVRRNRYEPAGEQFFDIADIQKALDYVAVFVAK